MLFDKIWINVPWPRKRDIKVFDVFTRTKSLSYYLMIRWFKMYDLVFPSIGCDFFWIDVQISMKYQSSRKIVYCIQLLIYLFHITSSHFWHSSVLCIEKNLTTHHDYILPIWAYDRSCVYIFVRLSLWNVWHYWHNLCNYSFFFPIMCYTYTYIATKNLMVMCSLIVDKTL
jgi:hypothetical protein